MSLQGVPGIYPLLVERIIVARPDLLKADVKEVRHLHQDALNLLFIQTSGVLLTTSMYHIPICFHGVIVHQN